MNYNQVRVAHSEDPKKVLSPFINIRCFSFMKQMYLDIF
jgi:hypothetical protein